MTLSWWRHSYVEFVFDQKSETFLACHERAFAWFGGVPERVVIDNLKAGVARQDGRDAVLSEPYRRLAQHYGFMISPNRPRTPRHKGKVESAVHYVKRNFLAGRTFADLTALNERVALWVRQVAGARCHGTTREAPLARFEGTERAALRSLPTEPFDLVSACHARVHRDCHVVVGGSYYSVPYECVGQRVEVYVGRRVVEIYRGAQLVATHLVAAQPGTRRTRTEHYPVAKRAFLEHPPERCHERAQGVGPACANVVGRLLAQRPADRLRSVQGLLRLGEKVGTGRLEAACQRALHYGDPSYRRVKTILAADLDSQPLDAAPACPVPPKPFQYERPATSFFPQEAVSC
jgi:hypothetical protein